MIEVNQEPTVIFGLNGVGKTNVLEAISMFAPGQGFRRARVSDLSRRPDLLGWKLVGQFKILDHKYEVITSWNNTSGRKVIIDGKLVTQASLAKFLRILWVTPLMDRIWLNGASERRRFLDRIVSSLVPEHTEYLINYYKALKQRNQILKNKIKDSNWYNVLEKQMALAGIQIYRARNEVISRIMEMQRSSESSFPNANLKMTGSTYLVAEELQLALSKSRKQEFYVGRTLVGPHLSDLEAIYSLKGVEAKNCSSGEQKALIISIILAVAKIQIELFNYPPILLFDEITAHLDEDRRSTLYDEIYKLNMQVFLTGTDIYNFRELKARAKYFEVTMNIDESICKPVEKFPF